MKGFLGLILLAYSIQSSSAIRCYTCSTTDTDVDQSCIDDVEKGAIIKDCNKKYCTAIRQEYLEPKGRVASMFRNCEDKPPFMNQIIEDEQFRTYYVACTTDLCNGGSGRSGDNDNKGSFGDKSTIYCPGTGGAFTLTPSIVMLTLLAWVIMFIKY